MIDLIAENKVPRESHVLPLTPMIDVVFLLITFFVGIQYRSLAGQLEAHLPKVPGVVRRLAPEDELIDRYVRVNVRPVVEGATTAPETFSGKPLAAVQAQPVFITVNSQPVGDFDALYWELYSKRILLDEQRKTPLLVLELDGRLNFQNVVSTVNAARRAQFTSISFTPPAGTQR